MSRVANAWEFLKEEEIAPSLWARVTPERSDQVALYLENSQTRLFIVIAREPTRNHHQPTTKYFLTEVLEDGQVGPIYSTITKPSIIMNAGQFMAGAFNLEMIYSTMKKCA